MIRHLISILTKNSTKGSFWGYGAFGQKALLGAKNTFETFNDHHFIK